MLQVDPLGSASLKAGRLRQPGIVSKLEPFAYHRWDGNHSAVRPDCFRSDTVGHDVGGENCQNVQAQERRPDTKKVRGDGEERNPAAEGEPYKNRNARKTSEFELAPVPFTKHPATVRVDVTGRHPTDTYTRRTNPMPSYPHISCAIPTLVTANPDISWPRSDSNDPDADRRRWRDANRGLRSSDQSSEQQHCAKRRASIEHV